MRRILVICWTCVFALCIAQTACSGCEDETPGVVEDAGLDAGDDVGSPGEDAAEDTAGDEDADEPDDVGDDAGDGDADTGDDTDAGDDNGDDACPFPYQAECGGECVNVNSDFDHCGECDNACEGEEACVGGECTVECMGSLQLCDNRCVDYNIDNEHCGECDNPCDDGEGCSEGECVDAVELGPTPDKCEGGGPPIGVDFGAEEVDQCSGEIAESTFLWALCTCGDLAVEDTFLTDGFDSSSGPYQPGGLGGGVGVDGDFIGESELEIWGAAYVGEPSYTEFGDEVEIRQQFRVGGDVEVGDQCDVYDDTHIAGDIDASGSLDIAGDLYSDPDADRSGTINYSNLIEQPVDVPPPCGCDDESVIPIGDIVADAAEDNDNELIGLDEDLFSGGDTPERVDLPCGHYYLSEIESGGDVTIVAEGRTALYIDGDIGVEGVLTLTPGPLGELDVFIDGDVLANSGFVLGSPNYPASTRLYIGGDGGMTISSEAEIGANIYAVPGTLMIEDQIEIFGALFAQAIVFESEAAIHYDRQTLRSGESCPEEDDDDEDDNGDDDNGDDNGDDEPVCVLEGESCEDDGDCCAPLICDEQTGTCGLMGCLPTGEDCTYADECCSEICADDGDGGTCVEL